MTRSLSKLFACLLFAAGAFAAESPEIRVGIESDFRPYCLTDALLCSKLIATLEMRHHGVRGVAAGPPIPDHKRVFSFAVRKGNAERRKGIILRLSSRGAGLRSGSGRMQSMD